MTRAQDVARHPPASATSKPGRRRQRLDVALVERGLETSRERARRLILAGEVTVDGQVAGAPSTLVPADAALAIGKRLPYVSRGGIKLAHALDRFAVDVAGRTCLDAGASTGGFTDCLLQRGARRVYALDVGKGLLAWRLRQDPRVVVLEEANVRYLRLAPGAAPPAGRPDVGAASTGGPGDQGPPPEGIPVLPEAVSLATIDVAFISLRLVLAPVTGAVHPGGEVIALVKPQFEAGPADVGKGGVVRDRRVHRRVLIEALSLARAAGLSPAGLTASPIRGEAGNVEFLLWARRAPSGETAGAGPVGALDDDLAVEGALAEAATLPPAGGRGTPSRSEEPDRAP